MFLEGIEISRIVFIINFILIIVIIFWGRNRPARSTMMWVMVMALLPIGGFFFYLLIGADTRRSNMFRLKESQDEKIRELTAQQVAEIEEINMTFSGSTYEDYFELATFALNVDHSVISYQNDWKLFFDGHEKFDSLCDDIDRAEESICIQYYIMSSDDLGKRVMHHLILAAQRGVHVRFLVDAFGGRSLRDRDMETMEAYGIEVAIFFPSILKHFNLRMNYRNHRKLVIIDDYIGYIGGFNVGDEYLGKNKRFGYWRDTHLRIEGEGTSELKIRFLQDWYHASGKDPEDEPEIQMHPYIEGNAPMQLITSGPDTTYDNIKYAMMKMISIAKHSIIIQTPYLVPDIAFMDTLLLALNQGVEVNIMIPDKPDHPIIYWATTSYAGELIKHGAKIYRYENGFLHAKVMIVDDILSMVGSANLDERSFSLNFEASEIIYSYEVNLELREQFAIDVENSSLLTEEMYEQRSLIQKIREPISRLFSPLL